MRSSQLLLCLGALALGLATGCSKKKDAATDSAILVATPAVSAQSPVDRQANVQLKDLQLQVDAYQKIYNRKPASLAAMVQEGFLPALPPAPPGQRFEYDPASNQVSLVP